MTKPVWKGLSIVPGAVAMIGGLLCALDVVGVPLSTSEFLPDPLTAAAAVCAFAAMSLPAYRARWGWLLGPLTFVSGLLLLLPALAFLAHRELPPQDLIATEHAGAGLLALFAGIAALSGALRLHWPGAIAIGRVAVAAVIYLCLLAAPGSLWGVADGSRLVLPLFTWIALLSSAAYSLLSRRSVDSAHNEPRPRWADYTAVGAAGICAVVLAGWLVQNAAIVQAGTRFVPMQFNTAIALLLLAIALKRVARSHLRTTLALCALPAALALMSIAEELNLVSASIDQSLFVHRIASEAVPPGRLALSTAVTLLLLCAAAVLQTARKPSSSARLVAWAVGLLALTIGALSLIGYLLGLPLVRAWGAMTPMAFNTACATLLLGLTVVLRGMRVDRGYSLRATLVPVFAVIVVAAATTQLWFVTLRTAESQQRDRDADLVARAGRNFSRELGDRVAMLGAVATGISISNLAPQDALDITSSSLMEAYPGLDALLWLDNEDRVAAQKSRPLSGEKALAALRGEGVPVANGELRTTDAGLALLATSGARGRLLAAFDLERMQTTIVRHAGLEGLVTIRAMPRLAPVADRYQYVEALGMRWRITVQPGASPLIPHRGREPALVMFGGLFVAGLVGMALRFALLARGRSIALTQQSAELRTRNTLLQKLSGGVAEDVVTAMLLRELEAQWPGASIAVSLGSHFERHAWPADLDAAAFLGRLRDGADTAAAEAGLRGWLRAKRRQACWQIVSDQAGEHYGAFIVMTPIDDGTLIDAALLHAIADVAQLSLARHTEQMELRDLHRTYESVVAFHPDAVLGLDQQGVVHSANAAARSLFDESDSPLIGRRLADLLDGSQNGMLDLRLRTVLDGTPQSAEVRATTTLRGARDMEMTLVPVRRREAISGAFALLHDVTRFRAADRALRLSHEHAQVFSRRLIDLNECAVDLAHSVDRGAAARHLVQALRDTLEASAVSIRLDGRDSADAPQGDFDIALSREGAVPPSASRDWFGLLGTYGEALALDRMGLLEALPGDKRPAPDDLPRRNWIAMPLHASNGDVLGRLEVFDARAEDDFEDVFTITNQFAQMGAASVQRLHLIEGVRAAEQSLLRQLAFTEAIASSIGDAVYAVDRAGKLNYLNPAAERMLGWTLQEVRHDAFEAELSATLQPASRALAENAMVHLPDAILRRRDGRFFPASCSASPLALDGRVVGAVVVVRDISERQRADLLQRERDRFFELSLELFCIADTAGNFHQVNSAFGRTLGYSADDLLTTPWIALVHPDDLRSTQAAAEALYVSGHLRDFCNRYRHADGSYRWLEWNAQRDSDGSVYASARDITEHRRIASELSHHATHDHLTDLPNLEQQQSFLHAALASAASRAGRVAVFYLDVDHFHAINETRGHTAGDAVLREVARRLRDATAERGLVSRVAGDEFLVVREEVSDWADQGDLGEDLRARIEEPMRLDGQQFFLTCSIGVSCFPENGATPTDLIRQAEAAMLRAKREGRNTVVAFSNDQLQLLHDRQRLGARLRDAIRDGELVLHYQPQINVHDWQVAGVEALVRWQSPELGLLLPGRFIQVAEEMGIIVEIGQWVLEKACQQAREWLDGGLADFSVAVNVSGLQLQRPDFLDRVRRALDVSGLPPRYLELELTESIIMEHVERVIGTMRALKALGVMISLDDFGSGYSSLSYLRRFPLDKLKIDQTFVRDITNDANAAGICRAIIALGHQLGLTVSAEGVETIGQAGFLRRAECDQFQGNYFSLPLPAPQVFDVLRRRYINRERLAPILEEREAARTLLLVDDEENVLRALVRLLRRDGYEILTAPRPREAMDILASRPVQVILSDQRMPDQSGTQFLSHVKEIYPATVRLILSGYSDLASLTDAINSGAIYRYIAKPWDDEDLRRQIREAFRLHEAQLTARAS